MPCLVSGTDCRRCLAPFVESMPECKVLFLFCKQNIGVVESGGAEPLLIPLHATKDYINSWLVTLK